MSILYAIYNYPYWIELATLIIGVLLFIIVKYNKKKQNPSKNFDKEENIYLIITCFSVFPLILMLLSCFSDTVLNAFTKSSRFTLASTAVIILLDIWHQLTDKR